MRLHCCSTQQCFLFCCRIVFHYEKNDGAADQIGKTKGEADFFFLSFFCGCCVLVIRRGVFPLQLLVFCEEQVQNQ